MPGSTAQPAQAALPETWTCPPLPGNNLEHWQLPAITPHSKTSRAKLACAAAPSTNNARHLNRVSPEPALPLSASEVAQTGGPHRLPQNLPDRHTPCLVLRISIPRDSLPCFWSSGLRLRKTATVSPTWSPHSLSDSHLLSGKAAWLSGNLSFTFPTGLTWQGV